LDAIISLAEKRAEKLRRKPGSWSGVNALCPACGNEWLSILAVFEYFDGMPKLAVHGTRAKCAACTHEFDVLS
jgi:uncharacterized protein (DUF983 family)